jgi:hypothetical protein
MTAAPSTALTDEHRAKLRTSALTDEQIDRLGWSTLPDGSLQIPYRQPDGGPEVRHDGSPFMRFRLSDAQITELKCKGNSKPGRYRSPKGNGCRLYHPALAPKDYQQRLKDSNRPLRITEGELKTEAATVHDPARVTIGLGGVSSWQDRYDGGEQSRPLVDFDEIPLDGREVRLCFDSDLRKPSVLGQLRKLATFLVVKGANVLIEVLPHDLDGERLGIDDLIYRHGPDAFLRIAEVPRSPGKVKRELDEQTQRYIRRLQWDFDPIPENTHQRIAYVFSLLGAHWRRGVDAKDAWHQWTGTHWADVAGNDEVSAALEGFTRLQEWRTLELGNMRSLLAAFRRSVRPIGDSIQSGLVPFRNGCVVLGENTLIPHDPAHGNRWALPYDFDPTATCPGVERFLLDRLGDVAAVALIRAMGRALLVGERTKAFVEITGPGDTGKSVVANLLMALVGRSNVAACTLQRIEDRTQRFETLKLRGRRLAVFSECQDYSGPLEILKALTGGDPIGAEVKGGRHLDFVFNGGVVLVGNGPVKSSDPTGAVINRRRSLPITSVVAPSEQRLMLDADDVGGWRGELVPELPGWANWCLSMPAAEARAALARDVRSLSRAEAELGILLNTDYLAEWAESTLVWVGSTDSFVRVGDARDASGEAVEGLYSSYRRFMEGQGNTRPLALRTFKSKLVDLLRDTLGLPMPAGSITARGPYSHRDLGSLVPCVRLRDPRDGDDAPGVVRHGFMARVAEPDSDDGDGSGIDGDGSGMDTGGQESSQGTDGMDGMDLSVPPLRKKSSADGDSAYRESRAESVPSAPSIPSKGFGHPPSIPNPSPSIPPTPRIHPECRMEVATWVAAARDALADRQLPHDVRACWKCLQAWQPAAPSISQPEVKRALDRLAPYQGAQQSLPGVAAA